MAEVRRTHAGVQHDQGTALHQRHPRRSGRQAVDEAEGPDDRRRVDVAAEALVVEADVAADDGEPQRQAGLGHAVDGFGQLPHHLGMLGIAEVEAVHDGHRRGSRAGQVEGRLGHRRRGARPRVQGAPGGIGVGGEGQSPLRRREARRGEPEHGAVAAGALDRVEEQLVVVLTVDPRRVGQQGQDIVSAVRRGRKCPGIVGQAGVLVGGTGERPAVEGSVLAQGDGGDVAEDGTVEAVEDAQPTGTSLGGFGDASDHRGPDLPLGTDLLHPRQVGRRDDGQHPLLALRRHDLVVGHARLATGHGRHVDVHAHPAHGRPSHWWRTPGRRHPGPGCPPRAWRRAARGRPRSAASPRRGRPPARSAAWPPPPPRRRRRTRPRRAR